MAPGKAVLLGEYAVLAGAPGLSMAVDRHACVNMEACAADECSMAAPQLGIEPVGFAIRPDGRVEWDVSSPGWPRLTQTANLFSFLYGLASRKFGQPDPMRIHIDTSELFIDRPGGSVKLGLGSSSAVAVAMDAALRQFAGGKHQPGLSMRSLNRLLKPYRRGQDGRGSGIDLATSLCGGLIRYQIIDDQASVTRVRLPDHLYLAFVWTGQTASTPTMLEGFQRWRQDRPEQSQQLLEAMTGVCESAQVAIRQGDSEALIEHFRDYGRLMGKMGSLTGLEVVSPVHARVAGQCERLGLVYKPCGAGAGDLGMVVTTDPGPLQALEDWLVTQDLPLLRLSMDVHGVRVQSRGIKTA